MPLTTKPPRVLDGKGRVLKIGRRVESRLYGSGQVVGLSLHSPNLDGMTVSVLFDSDTRAQRWDAKPKKRPNVFHLDGFTTTEGRER